jgi:hypothetical protein
MNTSPKVTVCVLTYGNHARLTFQVIESIRRHCPRHRYHLVVGANAVCEETRQYLTSLEITGMIDHLITSPVNLNKCPMMRRMFAALETEFIWWFDDDSYVLAPDAMERWLQVAEMAPESTVMWGESAFCDHQDAFTDLEDARAFVRSAAWYRGLPPPSWQYGGKGEFNFQDKGTGDGRWIFTVGGCWLIRTATVRALDWPDPRLIKLGDDVFLGEAIRQNGWHAANIGMPGVAINTEPRRGQVGSCAPSGKWERSLA